MMPLLKSFTTASVAAVFSFLLAFTASAVTPPGVMTHQGRILVNGANYTGTGYFKFAFVREEGAIFVTDWTNDGTASGEPAGAVPVNIVNGHYAVLLGDTSLTNMTEAIPAGVFSGNAEVSLRIWFSADGMSFEPLSPDRRLTTSAYAFSAAEIDGGKVKNPAFLGTTGNSALEITVDDQRALRIQPGSVDGSSPFAPPPGSSGPAGIVAGYEGNEIAAGIDGATISGGGGFEIVFLEGPSDPETTVRLERPNIVEGLGSYATIGGGSNNRVSAPWTTVGGGEANQATSRYATVGGGRTNISDATAATIGGGLGNQVSGFYATIPGGLLNSASGQASFAAGRGADALHDGTFVWSDSSTADFASTGVDQFLIRAEGGVGIGTNDPQAELDVAGTIKADAFEGMGANFALGTTDASDVEFKVNTVTALRLQSTGSGNVSNLIGGSEGNQIDAGATGAVIAGGGAAGGVSNYITDTGSFSTISGGLGNQAENLGSTVGGGNGNQATGFYAVVGGGRLNSASGNVAAIAGGESNNASGSTATIAGGNANQATGFEATVGGGVGNVASGLRATIPGGESNGATADYSFAAGRRAKSIHEGAFVWADATNADFASTADNQFAIRADGGVRIFDPTDPTLLLQSDGTNEPSGRISLRQSNNTGYDIVYDGVSDVLAFESFTSGTSGGSTLSLDLDGNIGVNTSDPQGNLHIASENSVELILEADTDNLNETDQPSIRMRQDGGAISGSIGFFDGSNNFEIRSESTETATDIILAAGDRTKVVADKISSVMDIVNSSSSSNADGLYIQMGPDSAPGSNNNFVAFFDGDGTFTGSIDGNGTGGVAYKTTSDRRLKQDIVDLPNALATVDKLQPREYAFRVAPDQKQAGFIAQEILDVFPQATSGDPEGNVDEDPMMVDYSAFTPLLTGAVQELHGIVQAQRESIEALERENAALHERLLRLETALGVEPAN
jgi:hypothetical protein